MNIRKSGYDEPSGKLGGYTVSYSKGSHDNVVVHPRDTDSDKGATTVISGAVVRVSRLPRQIRLDADIPEYAEGVILKEIGEDGRLHLVLYMSGKKNYPIAFEKIAGTGVSFIPKQKVH